MKSNFIGIGAQKCASSSYHYERSYAWYERQFAEKPVVKNGWRGIPVLRCRSACSEFVFEIPIGGIGEE
jgi:hypothetical protein